MKYLHTANITDVKSAHFPTQYAGSVLVQYWASFADGGPTLDTPWIGEERYNAINTSAIHMIHFMKTDCVITIYAEWKLRIGRLKHARKLRLPFLFLSDAFVRMERFFTLLIIK